MYKICTKCKEPRPIDAYFKDKQKANGFHSHCKKCVSPISVAWGKANKERKHFHQMKCNYGIDVLKYSKKLEEQGHACAICKQHKSKFRLRLHVDHNHETGEVRGLLCRDCNFGLGNFKDNLTRLREAITYLEYYSCQ